MTEGDLGTCSRDGPCVVMRERMRELSVAKDICGRLRFSNHRGDLIECCPWCDSHMHLTPEMVADWNPWAPDIQADGSP